MSPASSLLNIPCRASHAASRAARPHATFSGPDALNDVRTAQSTSSSIALRTSSTATTIRMPWCYALGRAAVAAKPPYSSAFSAALSLLSSATLILTYMPTLTAIHRMPSSSAVQSSTASICSCECWLLKKNRNRAWFSATPGKMAGTSSRARAGAATVSMRVASHLRLDV